MNIKDEIFVLYESLLPNHEIYMKMSKKDLRNSNMRLLSVIIGMYLANKLTGQQIKDLVNQLEKKEEA